MKRVGLILYPLMSRGGVFVWARSLASELKRYGVETHVLVGSSSRDVDVTAWDWSPFASVTTIGHGTMPRFPTRQASRHVGKWTASLDPWLLVGGSPYANVVVARLDQAMQIPRVATLHAYLSGARGWLYKIAYRLLSGRWHAAVYVSSDLRDAFRGLVRSKRQLIAPPEVRQFAGPAARDGDGRARLRLLYLGRLEMEKGVLEVPQLLRGLEEDVELWVAGAGSLEGEIRRQLPTSRYLGWVDDPGACYRACDVLLHPSPDEGFGLVLREALTVGLLIVCRKSRASVGAGVARELTYEDVDEGHRIIEWLVAEYSAGRWPPLLDNDYLPEPADDGSSAWSSLLALGTNP
jgi:glycosyltransferase involved in cell wall biosynthesis